MCPERWLEWEGSRQYLKTLYYVEYKNYRFLSKKKNYRLGAKLENRVKQPGHHLLNSSQASYFTVANFILGDQWLRVGYPIHYWIR